ncbi:efflux RND transporter permease subunit [Marinimicrobium alkaliphilum]|uniref:efflux RND transporter permease subunit n=1 Tax=Marinimicrobium alkaliphilum TaxID=2202654 RepID=UPI000DBA6BDC|nr:efflux RND transporter permease subunit [Marinimicrobium alkaliphilum]
MTEQATLFDRFIHLCLREKLIPALLLALTLGLGLAVSPFDWHTPLPRSPVPVDAIPNLGENQQIVYSDWPGHSPRDVEDQLTYPLTTALMGVPGVVDVRSLSMFGSSFITVIFEEDAEFYWARARLLEKLSSLSAGTLPEGVQPALGPDATGLGQVFWYTLEGRDPDGNPAGGWELHELRSLQDWHVRYGLMTAEGISEVASVGGYVREYQIDLDPDALRIHEVTLEQVLAAVRDANLDVSAGPTEINQVEYLVRGVGFIRSLSDIEQAVVRPGPDQTPIRVKDVAHVTLGPAERRGVLDVDGAEAVGGVVTVREGFNPRAAITNTRAKIDEIAPGLPARAWIDWSQTHTDSVDTFTHEQQLPAKGPETVTQWTQWLEQHPREQWPDWLTLSQVTIEPFYDRSELIQQTLGTLNDALLQQMLVTAIVILLLLGHLRAALGVSLMLPLAVLMAFIAMRYAGVDANIVSLAGIAIAIGTIVDMGIIISESVLHRTRKYPDEPLSEQVYEGTREVGSAVLTAVATTVISFLPVFTMTGAEGKLFAPLAYTKTFILIAAIILALVLIPALLRALLALDVRRGLARVQLALAALLVPIALVQGWGWVLLGAALLALTGAWVLWHRRLPPRWQAWGPRVLTGALALTLLISLAGFWEPLGPGYGRVGNSVFLLVLFGVVVGASVGFLRLYPCLLRACLNYKPVFLVLPVAVVVLGLWSWSQMGREFMPPLDEGSFLWMPTTMPHASLGAAKEIMQQQDKAIAAIPEVDTVVGKLGRAETALDPAPLSMIETVITYKNEYKTDADGRRLNFRYDRSAGEFVRDDDGDLIPDRRGRPYRQWREHIQSPSDIWDEISRAATVPGATSAPRLQPIETRQLMLQTGMRASMGIKVAAPDLATLDELAVRLEALMREAPGVNSASVNADRVVGKPYLEIHPDRAQIARYGLSMAQVQNTLAAAIGGATATRTVEGRERYPVRVRYPRELRQTPEQMARILVATPDGTHIPLGELAEIRYERGPQMIRTENTFLTGYVTFAAASGWAEVDVVEAVRDYLENARAEGEWRLPAGSHYQFAGSYEHQQRAMQTLQVVIPVALALILIILYLQFRTLSTSLMVFSSIAVAWGGGFIMLWLYGQDWFANVSVFGINLRELFQLHTVNLSVAVWVGFLALFGIAVDDAVMMATHLRQRFDAERPATVDAIRACALSAGQRRARPALLTTTTTVLALLPVLTATGRGADLMIPMAIPTLGGLVFVLLSLFSVPVLYAWREEWRLR